MCSLRDMNYRNIFDLSVYFVLDPSVCAGRKIEDVVSAAVKGGVTMVQLRNKHDSLDVIEGQARAVQNVLADTNIPFIINDYVKLAAKINADGVHIGQEDMSASEARSIIGDDKILGVTAYTQGHYKVIDPNMIDYVGTGPFYATKTKPDKPVLGADGFAQLVKTALVPVVGIGGITPDNARDVIAAGAQGVAMMRSLSEADDIEIAARSFVHMVRKARNAYSKCA